MRIAHIGTGWIAPQHLDALASIPEIDLIAVAGRDLGRAEALAKPRGAVAYGDWAAMVAQERLDGVILSVPPDAAGPIARALAGKVRGILVEKPVDAELAGAEATAQIFAERGTIAAAGYHNRARSMVGQIKALCALTPVVVADAWWHGGMPGAPWWRRRAQSGGQMSEQLTHFVDLLRIWLGEAEEVSAFAAHGFMSDVPDFDIDDAVAATVRFAGGAIATIHTSCIARPGQDIDGLGIALRARGWQAQLTGWGLAGEIRHAGGTVQTIPEETDLYRIQAQSFCAALAAQDSRLLSCTFSEGVETLRLTRAIDRAAATGKPQRVRP